MVYRSAPPNSNDIIYVWNASELKYVDSLTSTKSCFILRAVCELKLSDSYSYSCMLRAVYELKSYCVFDAVACCARHVN